MLHIPSSGVQVPGNSQTAVISCALSVCSRISYMCLCVFTGVEATVLDLPPPPENTTRASSAGLMLGHRRRRWPNINPALDQCIVFASECISPTLYAYHIIVIHSCFLYFLLIFFTPPMYYIKYFTSYDYWQLSVVLSCS